MRYGIFWKNWNNNSNPTQGRALEHISKIMQRQFNFTMKKIEKLTLAEATQIEIDDKENPGKKIKMWKYVFFKPDGNILVGYSQSDKLKSSVNEVGTYDDKLAKEYGWVGKEFQGQVRWKLEI